MQNTAKTIDSIVNGQKITILVIVKMEIDEGARHLLEMQNLIREKNKTEAQMPLREPDLLIVLTGGEFAYTREDGVKVIPLGCLKD